MNVTDFRTRTMIHDTVVISPCKIKPCSKTDAEHEYTAATHTSNMRRYKMTCCQAVIVDKLMVDKPVTVMDE